MWNYIINSTLKREAATVLMLWLLAMSTFIIVKGPPDTQMQVLQLFALPISLIFAGAYGLDWISKQTNIAGPPAPMREPGSMTPMAPVATDVVVSTPSDNSQPGDTTVTTSTNNVASG
ncbi:hypothetical protein [Rhizobium sp. HT1-10]|uniref:hypothetical protein n=1 Tax=Rhizobium sp. HT1-10 TaxID=3111638 RepID=UPI003C21AF82